MQKENELRMSSELKVGQNGHDQERALVRRIKHTLLLAYSKPIYGKHNIRIRSYTHFSLFYAFDLLRIRSFTHFSLFYAFDLLRIRSFTQVPHFSSTFIVINFENLWNSFSIWTDVDFFPVSKKFEFNTYIRVLYAAYKHV